MASAISRARYVMTTILNDPAELHNSSPIPGRQSWRQQTPTCMPQPSLGFVSREKLTYN